MLRFTIMAFVASLSSISASAEPLANIDSFIGEYSLVSGSANCYSTFDVSLQNNFDKKYVSVFGGSVDSLFYTPVSFINNGSFIEDDASAKATSTIVLSSDLSTLTYVSKGKNRLSEDGIPLSPFSLSVEMIKVEDNSLQVNIKSFAALRTFGFKNMKCLYKQGQ